MLNFLEITNLVNDIGVKDMNFCILGNFLGLFSGPLDRSMGRVSVDGWPVPGKSGLMVSSHISEPHGRREREREREGGGGGERDKERERGGKD